MRSFSFLMVVVCTEPLVSALMIIGVKVVQPCRASIGWSVSYFSSLLVIATRGNLLLQYVNSTICTFKFGLGVNEGNLVESGVPRIHSMLRRSPTRHLHLSR